MRDAKRFQAGQIVRYTSPEGRRFDAVVKDVPDSHSVVIQYRPRIIEVQRLVSATTLSIPR